MNSQSSQLANRFREVILNGKWVANTNFKEQVSNVTLDDATKKIGSLNTIALLTFHIHYYVAGVLKVLEGGSLEISDKFSFDIKPNFSKDDWELLKSNLWNDAERFATLVEQIPDSKLNDVFVDAKYGTYLRNIDGMIEHCYYHLGQIVLIKKLLK
ncbi:DUF1572 domain-containing protein [Subsaxibacter sp. CAU 1640]|uniref:DUF1572 domain-containing protein n=1 Tax=Subsaxibacter sp. CAU 1640 TaxID=2933271 RepID=UPI0020040764|nr:DUF1572 domain-containing protein [Subsaxibacter sp. CAU 1640]MCK7590001.1 DUF1572 domain-containing protein [Subsaxibacter sp. CAU 1640]